MAVTGGVLLQEDKGHGRRSWYRVAEEVGARVAVGGWLDEQWGR